ncbi:MAG: hypothetical protein WBA68_00510 [Alteraurantiacibacter sp.]
MELIVTAASDARKFAAKLRMITYPSVFFLRAPKLRLRLDDPSERRQEMSQV